MIELKRKGESSDKSEAEGKGVTHETARSRRSDCVSSQRKVAMNIDEEVGRK